MAGAQSSRPRLNDLDGKTWVKSTKSWFVINPIRRNKGQIVHPAKYPEELVARFVTYFTCEGGWVLDPFAGVASTNVACKMIGRNSVGVELNPEFVSVGQDQIDSVSGNGLHHILQGNSMSIADVLKSHFDDDIPKFDYLITSPPYWDMLRKSRGGNDTAQKERAERGLKQTYSESQYDLGNLNEYDDYIKDICQVFRMTEPYLKDGAYLTVVAQNMRDVDGTLRPIAWDLARNLSDTFDLRQEQIWCQDNKRLGCWGFPTTYVSNVHHHYCIVLQKCRS